MHKTFIARVQRLLRFLPDQVYLQLYYFAKFKRFFRPRNPQTFSEKLQWLKLHDRKPEYTRMVDKHQAKDWAAARIGEQHIVPLLGVWDSFDEIDFSTLPNQFVLKCTHDSGGLVICTDFNELDLEAARKKIEHSLQQNYYFLSREWAYKNVKPRILAERYFPSWIPPSAQGQSSPAPNIDPERGVLDYKFYCFNGEPKFLYVSEGLDDHSTAKIDFLDCNWMLTAFSRPDFQRFDILPPKPERLDDMVALARKLSAGIPFVRVDFFQHYGEILFSEMTFSPAGGMMRFTPPEADKSIGDLLDLTTNTNFQNSTA